MNFFATGKTSLQNVTAKFTKRSSPYDIYKKINEYYAKNDNNNRVLLRIYVIGVENIRIYKNSIVIRNFLDSNKSISLKINKYKDYFMNNLCKNHKKFEYFVRNHQKYAFSVIDFLGNPFIFIKTISVIKDFHFLREIKTTLFKNINKYIDFHDNQEEKIFAPTSAMSVDENKVCEGCDICRSIQYLGKLLEDKRYSKICVWKNQLINKNHCIHIRDYIKNSLGAKTDLSKISAVKLCWCVPYIILFFNLEMPQGEYTKQILGMKSKNANLKISHIKQELIRRNIIYIKNHGGNDFGNYKEFIFHEPRIHHTKQQHRQIKISVQFADGHEQIFESISECAKHFGYSRQLVAYHLDKLHSPLGHKIFQSF